ncbi:MAG: hypothetical protein J6N70_19485 [Oribacterium sp.]|nr:hypothetical protein [Oribacterium sp.]
MNRETENTTKNSLFRYRCVVLNRKNFLGRADLDGKNTVLQARFNCFV